MKIDPVLLLIIFLLLTTLAAFFVGHLSYPVGLILLLFLLYFRIRDLKEKKQKNS